MPEQIRTLNSKNTKTRVILCFAIFFTLVFAWLAVRWQIGDMLAELTSLSDPSVVQAAAAAKSLAPHDPLANWLAASVGQTKNSAAAFENVVRLAPNDFRWWIELGRIYEQEGDEEKAEKAFRHATEIAPAYAYPRWQLGNFYLRQGRGDNAFAELKKAAVGNDVYPEQVFAIAWDYFEKDTAKINEIAGDSPAAKKGLVKFYIAKERPADALVIYNSLTPEKKTGDSNFSQLITDVSYQKRFFKSSQEFARQSGIDAESKFENISNGGFEREILDADATYFSWKLLTAEKIDIKTDATQKHEGNRSLRVVFSGFANSYIGNVRQVVAVEPSQKYHLNFWVKTENLRSTGAPTVEIINANDDKLFAVTKSFSTGTNDWQQFDLDFTAPENCEAITLKIGRTFCGEQCPIYGTIWLDDFRLDK